MEPALDERGDDHETTGGPPLHRAAMEPALDERGDPGRPCWLRSPRRSRNGARSRRAGRPIRCLGRYTTNAWAAMEPALDERGDHAPDRTASPPSVAAMEPALDERGDHFCPGRWHRTGKPQWSPLSTSGATGRRCRWPPRFDCRNGARSRRAGRRASQVGGCDLGEDAAMEPALDERGDDELRHAGRIDLVPQWSPLSTSGATGNTVRPAGPDARAAMEPALD